VPIAPGFVPVAIALAFAFVAVAPAFASARIIPAFASFCSATAFASADVVPACASACFSLAFASFAFRRFSARFPGPNLGFAAAFTDVARAGKAVEVDGAAARSDSANVCMPILLSSPSLSICAPKMNGRLGGKAANS